LKSKALEEAGVGFASTFGLPGASGDWDSPFGLVPLPSAPLQAEGRRALNPSALFDY